MRFGTPWSTTLALGILLAGCNGTSTPGTPSGGPGKAAGTSQEDVGATLATVNGVTIGSTEFEKAAARTVPEEGDTLSADEKREILDRLVGEKVLYLEALRQGLDQDPKVQKVMVNTLLRQDVYSQVRNSDFSEEVLEAYFSEHLDEFVVPEKVQIKRILIRVTDERPDAEAKAEAERLRAEVLSDPENSFKDVASKYSEDPYRRRGGDVGFISAEGKPGLDQEIVDKAFQMENKAVSQVFKTADGYNVIYVANKREQVERTFQQMKGSVLRKVKNDKLKELYEDYVSKLKNGATLQVNEDALSAVEIKRAAKPVGAPGLELRPATIPGADDETEGLELGMDEDVGE